MDNSAESPAIEPEAELVGPEDQADTLLAPREYEADPEGTESDPAETDGTAWAFDEKPGDE